MQPLCIRESRELRGGFATQGQFLLDLKRILLRPVKRRCIAILPASCAGQRTASQKLSVLSHMEKGHMTKRGDLTPAKRKRLLKTFGPCPAGYTNDDLERSLDLIYGLYSHLYTPAELRQIVVSDPFDRSATPRCLKLVELADWLEALVA